MEKNFVDIFDENMFLKVCTELGVKLRFENSITRYFERSSHVFSEFVWMSKEQLMRIYGIGQVGAKELEMVQFQMLCEKLI